MQRKIQLADQEVSYTLRKSTRARQLRITVGPDSEVVVTVPSRISMAAAESFVLQKAQWILKNLDYFSRVPKIASPQYTYQDYIENKERAREFAARKIEEFNTVYKFSVGKINIKNQKSIWGSCSRKGNLNFNYKIVFLPERAAEYIVVHELCHLQHPNHSQKFWDLVARVFPDHKKIRKELRKKI